MSGSGGKTKDEEWRGRVDRDGLRMGKKTNQQGQAEYQAGSEEPTLQSWTRNDRLKTRLILKVQSILT